ncbi:MAG: hypothetical protein OSB03_19530, partial [Vicinamibacterales bacterium]|nr:hypothetical protein [Vicinamibacterales bacterium]
QVAAPSDGGFVRSIFSLVQADLDAPDHTTGSRRGLQPDVELGRVPAGLFGAAIAGRSRDRTSDATGGSTHTSR